MAVPRVRLRRRQLLKAELVTADGRVVVADLAEQARDVAVRPVAGNADDPNLEAVAALRPDLVIGWTGGIEDRYAALSAIAPTVAVDVDSTDVAVSLRAIAAAVAELGGSPLWPTLPAVRAGRVVEVNSQESVGSYGFPGYDSVLDTLVDQWTALRARSTDTGGPGSAP